MKITEAVALDFEPVALTENVVGFRKVRVAAFDDEGRKAVATIEAGAGGYVCTEVTVAGNGSTITGDTLRKVPVAAMVREASQLVAFRQAPDEPAQFADWDSWPQRVMEEWPNGDLEDVARWTAGTYAMAAYRGIGPTRAVREAAGVSQTTAGRLIRSARDLGFLTVAAPKQTGGAPKRKRDG